MSEFLEFDPSELWYIKLDGYGARFPPDAWGGYSQDFKDADTVYSHRDIVDAEHDYWGVCGCQDIDHGARSLLIFDLDLYKADDFDPERITVPDDTLIVKSQNGGLHLYFMVHTERGALTESDFQTTADLDWDIDTRGSSVSMHVVAPTNIPGNNSPYEVVNNAPIKTVFDPADAAERIHLDGDPLLEYNPDRSIGSGVTVDRDADPPGEMPTCYHRGLQLRAAAPDDHPNTHKVNVLTALCGLSAGYDVDTMVTHFVDDYPPDDVDEDTTRYQLNHLANHVDRGAYSPPAISSLRDFGILEDDETCHCDIPYHGGQTSELNGGDQAVATDGGTEAHTATNNESSDTGDIQQKFIAACRLYSIDHTKVGTERKDDENYPIGIRTVIPEASIGDAVMAFNRNADRLDGTDTQAVIGHVVLQDLQDNGEFFETDDGRLFYFYNPEHHVYRVDGPGNRTLTEDFQGLVWDRYNLFAGQFSRNLGDDIKTQARREAPIKDVYRFAHYDQNTQELYITDWGDGYYAISKDGIEHRANGSDVFFLTDDIATPYEYLDSDERPELPAELPGERPHWQRTGDSLMRLFGNRVNYDEHVALGPSQQRKQLYLHLHTLPLIDLLDARPIMAWVGEKGSGKTVIERSIGQFIYGEDYTESIFPDDKDDFVAKVTNQALAFIDNYDEGVAWADDILAAVSTGAGVDLRELYTTNDLRRERPRCWLSITSRDPDFRRDDVADRTLVFRVARLEGEFIGMGDYLAQVTDYRDLLWSTYLDNLQDVMAALDEHDTEQMASSHRMADWAIYARIVSEALDVDDIDDLLETIETERATFALEDEAWTKVIDSWIRDDPEDAGTWRKASSLVDHLQEKAEDEGYPWPFSTSSGLGNTLSQYRDELGQLYGLEVDDGRVNKYRFGSADEGAPGHLDRYS